MAQLAIAAVQEVVAGGADLVERGDGTAQHHRGRVLQQLLDDLLQVIELVLVNVVNFGQRVRRALPHVRRTVRGAFARRQQLNLDDVGHANGRHHAQCQASNELIAARHVLLERVDRQQRDLAAVVVEVGVVHQVDVHHLLQLNTLHDHVLYNVRKELRDLAPFGQHGQQQLHALHLLRFL